VTSMRKIPDSDSMSARALLASLAAFLVASVGSLVVTTPAAAKPGFLTAQQLFGNSVTTSTPTSAMAGDGSVVVGRDVPGDDGGLEVQVRRPGGTWGATTVLQAAAAGANPGGLTLVGGTDGTLAATWNGGSGVGYRVSVLRPGARTWQQPRSTGVLRSPGAVVLDSRSRLWVGGLDATTGATRVDVFGPSGAPLVFTIPRDGTTVDQAHQLVVGDDGVGRLVLTRRKSTLMEAGGVTTCTTTDMVMAVDLTPGAAPEVSTIETYEGTGTSPSTSICTVNTGSTLGLALLTARAGGNATLVTSSRSLQTNDWTILSRRAAPGTAWPTSADQVVPPGARTPEELTVVGARTVLALTEPSSAPGYSLVTRGPSGPWSPPTRLANGTGSDLELGGGPHGGFVVWHLSNSPFIIRSRPILTSGRLGPAVTIDAVAVSSIGNALVDRFGNGGFAYLLQGSGPARFQPYDGAGPRVVRTVVPKTARKGRAVRLRASAVDTWSGVRGYRWKVDGKTYRTRMARVVFKTGGVHRVVLTVVDKRGTATVVRRQVRVTAPGR